MFNSRDTTKRSPSDSTLAESVRGGSGNLLTRQTLRLSSVSEDNKNNIVRKITRSTSASSNASESEANSKASTSGKPVPKIPISNASQQSTKRNGSDNEYNKQQGINPMKTTALSKPKDLITRVFNLGTKHGFENDKSKSKYKYKPVVISNFPKGKDKQNIFEKVDRHDGHTTYLGSGSFSRLEDCIANCLSHGQLQTNNRNRTGEVDFPFKRLTRASVLEDYSYEGISAPSHYQELRSQSNQYGQYSRDDHYSSDHKKSAAELSLNEIQQVNDALAKYGVPIFSHHDHHHGHHHNHHHNHHQDYQYNHHDQNQHHHHHHHHQKPGHIGEILSACQLLMKDPTIASLRPRNHADSYAQGGTQHHPPPTNYQGYPSSSVPGASSHLFGGPQQTPYSPVQGVGPSQSSYNPAQSALSKLFNSGPNQTPYSPVQGAASNSFGGAPPQNSYNPVQGAPSNLFGGGPPQNFYNPVQGAASNLFGGGPPQNSYNPVQGVASRLFG